MANPGPPPGDRRVPPGVVPVEPGPGQESVWDYPRPPVVVPCADEVLVRHRGVVVARSTAALRLLETSQAPAYYVPRADVTPGVLHRSERRSVCEWKGVAGYWHVVVDGGEGRVTVPDAAWSYEAPTGAYPELAGHVAFYAQLLDECRVGGEPVVPNEGSFYGGWVTSKVVGPFKGGPGSHGW